MRIDTMDVGAEQRNREVFAEAMEIIRLAWAQDRFACSGEHFTLPPTGIPDRGGVVTDLTSKPVDVAPTLEESVRQQIWAVGTADDVAEVVDEYRQELGTRTISVAVDGPGTTRESIEEQLTLVAEEVAPRLGVTMAGPA